MNKEETPLINDGEMSPCFKVKRFRKRYGILVYIIPISLFVIVATLIPIIVITSKGKLWYTNSWDGVSSPYERIDLVRDQIYHTFDVDGSNMEYLFVEKTKTSVVLRLRCVQDCLNISHKDINVWIKGDLTLKKGAKPVCIFESTFKDGNIYWEKIAWSAMRP